MQDVSLPTSPTEPSLAASALATLVSIRERAKLEGFAFSISSV